MKKTVDIQQNQKHRFEKIWWSLNLPGLKGILEDPLIHVANRPGGNINSLGFAITVLLPYLFLFAGIILLGMLIAGGFAIMTALGNEEKMTNGKTRITHALIGFLALFGVYWLAQIVQILFKIPIL